MTIVKYGHETFLGCDLEWGTPMVVCVDCLVCMQVGSFAQHMKKCASIAPIDLFTELPSGKGKKKNDSANFWRSYFPDHAAKMAISDLTKAKLTKEDIREQTEAFQAYATQILETMRRKCAERHFFLIRRNKITAMLMSPRLHLPVRGLCLCKTVDGDGRFCGHTCSLNRITEHMATHIEKTDIAFHRPYEKIIELEMGVDRVDERGEGGENQNEGGVNEGRFQSEDEDEIVKPPSKKMKTKTIMDDSDNEHKSDLNGVDETKEETGPTSSFPGKHLFSFYIHDTEMLNAESTCRFGFVV